MEVKVKSQIETNKAPGAIGPYSQAILAGDYVFVSGQLPVDMATGEMQVDPAKAAKASLDNINAILNTVDLDMSNIVKTLIFLTDMNDFAAVNEVYATYFKEMPPARSCIAVTALPKGAVLEIEAIASK